jgi:hypothetical protein
MSHDAVGDTPQPRAAESGAAMRRHHDQVRSLVAPTRTDYFHRVAGGYGVRHRDVCSTPKLARDRCEIPVIVVPHLRVQLFVAGEPKRQFLLVDQHEVDGRVRRARDRRRGSHGLLCER